jgi:hypothetical protein
MNARERLELMVRTDRGSMTVWSPAEVRNALDAYRVEVLTKAGVEYEDCSVCGAAQAVGRPCNTCAFRARIAAETGEKATASAATATPDFFQVDHPSTCGPYEFRCITLTPYPATRELRAIGWMKRGERRPEIWALDPDDNVFCGWIDVTNTTQGDSVRD